MAPGLSSPAYRTFKIGSAKNVASRLEQWGAQCPSHDPKLLGVCPGEEGSRLRGMRAEAEAGRGVRGREWFESEFGTTRDERGSLGRPKRS